MERIMIQKIVRMLKVRLTRTGRKNDPHFRVVVVESHRKPKSGAFLEILGHHHPRQKQTVLERERILHWQSKGAQLSQTVSDLMRKTEQEKNKVVIASEVKQSSS